MPCFEGSSVSTVIATCPTGEFALLDMPAVPFVYVACAIIIYYATELQLASWPWHVCLRLETCVGRLCKVVSAVQDWCWLRPPIFPVKSSNGCQERSQLQWQFS